MSLIQLVGPLQFVTSCFQGLNLNHHLTLFSSSRNIIQAHLKLQKYIGLDVDPVAHGKAQSKIDNLVRIIPSDSTSSLKAHVLLKNFKQTKRVIAEVDDTLLTSGVDGILMDVDLGMSSMSISG